MKAISRNKEKPAKIDPAVLAKLPDIMRGLPLILAREKSKDFPGGVPVPLALKEHGTDSYAAKVIKVMTEARKNLASPRDNLLFRQGDIILEFLLAGWDGSTCTFSSNPERKSRCGERISAARINGGFFPLDCVECHRELEHQLLHNSRAIHQAGGKKVMGLNLSYCFGDENIRALTITTEAIIQKAA